MLNLPQSTEFNKRIPKHKFYENITVTPVLKRIFAEQIKTVYWRNKIAITTTNLAPGEKVNEIEILEVKLNSVTFDENVLRQIDKGIPYHIIFLLEHEGNYQIWTAYKEISTGNAFKIGAYYHTEWLPESELSLKIDGLNIDIVYENFVRQIAGNSLQPKKTDESLEETVARTEKRKNLEKQITALQAKIRKEKQLNKQITMNTELKSLKKALEELTGESR